MKQYYMLKGKGSFKQKRNECIKLLFSNCRIRLSIVDIIVDIENEKYYRKEYDENMLI